MKAIPLPELIEQGEESVVGRMLILSFKGLEENKGGNLDRCNSASFSEH